VNQESGFANPDKGIACINDEQNLAYLSTYGQPEPLARGTTGTPRPITVERKHGATDIETLTRQVYLLSQCHIGVANTTTRLPITTAYADRAATAAAKGHLPMSTDLETGIGFL
jgi:argonaute-like protein implicated in RNA metabolism and viral defense